MVLQIAGLMFAGKFIEGRVVANRRWTPHLYSLRIQTQAIPFAAGQFARLALVIDGEQVARPYSFVNAPHEPIMEFYSSVVPGGPLSPKLAGLAVKDRVLVSDKGSGFLVLDEVPEGKNLWLLSTGTGLGPFLSILKTGVPWRRFESVVLVHGVRREEDLSYRDTIGEFSREHAGQFTMIPFVSRERPDFAMPGRIPEAIDSGALERRAGISFDDYSQVMVCGNPDMIRDATAALQRKGLRKNRRRSPGHITVERYW